MSFEVPTIDLTPYVAEGTPERRAAVAAALDDACRTIGFIQVVGHGIPAGTIDGLAAAMDDLFDLPLEAKSAYRTPPELNRGYAPPRSETLTLSLGVQGGGDYFEAFNVGSTAAEFPGLDLPANEYADNVWPREAPGFRPAVEAYFAEASRVARVLTSVFVDALGLPEGFFTPFTDHSIDVMRMNNYALPAGTVIGDDLTGMGAHTDYGIVTVLWADQAPGLQVLGPDRRWHDVIPADGALLVNLGDLTARWTNERWLSTLHRVEPPIVDGTIRRRRSAAYFHDGNIDAVITTLPSCLAPGETSPFPPITVGEHLNAKLAGSRAGRAYTVDNRDAERMLSARS